MRFVSTQTFAYSLPEAEQTDRVGKGMKGIRDNQ